MKLIALLILLSLNIYCQEKINYVSIEYIDGDTVHFSFESIGTDHYTDFGSFIIKIENNMWKTVQRIEFIPMKHENVHLDAVLFKGIFRIIFFDYKMRFLAKSKYFSIPNFDKEYER